MSGQQQAGQRSDRGGVAHGGGAGAGPTRRGVSERMAGKKGVGVGVGVGGGQGAGAGAVGGVGGSISELREAAGAGGQLCNDGLPMLLMSLPDVLSDNAVSLYSELFLEPWLQAYENEQQLFTSSLVFAEMKMNEVGC